MRAQYIAAFMGIAMSAAACAATAAYNPDQLGAGQVARVAEICTNVMGLDPSEPLIWGMHTGVSDLDSWTSHYRGCVSSLSNSLQQVDAEQSAGQAEQECRAKGLEPGSPGLAVCVLQSTEAGASPAPLKASAAAAASDQEPIPAATSFYRASNRQISRREQLACAELGFEPPLGPFASCVRNLKETLFAIDNPVGN